MVFENGKKSGDSREETVVDNLLVLECGDLVFSLGTGLVDLCLFGTDERSFVHIRMDFYIRVIRELKSVLEYLSIHAVGVSPFGRMILWARTYPLAVVNWHDVIRFGDRCSHPNGFSQAIWKFVGFEEKICCDQFANGALCQDAKQRTSQEFRDVLQG